jgi:hypothetical protein
MSDGAPNIIKTVSEKTDRFLLQLDYKPILILHDLHPESKAYCAVNAELHGMGLTLSLMENAWIVVTALTCVEIWEKCVNHLGEFDNLFIVELAGDWSSCGLDQERIDWLKKNLDDKNRKEPTAL